MKHTMSVAKHSPYQPDVILRTRIQLTCKLEARDEEMLDGLTGTAELSVGKGLIVMLVSHCTVALQGQSRAHMLIEMELAVVRFFWHFWINFTEKRPRQGSSRCQFTGLTGTQSLFVTTSCNTACRICGGKKYANSAFRNSHRRSI